MTLSAYDRVLAAYRAPFAREDGEAKRLVDHAMTDTLPSDIQTPEPIGEEK